MFHNNDNPDAASQYNPVFVVGAPRSGTTLLTLILMSSDAFSTYRAESALLPICQHKYGSLISARGRKRFLRDWFQSMQFDRSGLTRDEFVALVDRHGASWYRLLDAFMSEMAYRQNKRYWADSEPNNIFYLEQIGEHLPNARMIHIVRDGRAVATSQEKLGWLALPVRRWPRAYRLLLAGLQWEASVRAATRFSQRHPDRLLTVRYEDLIEHPHDVITRIAEFLKVASSSMIDSEESPLSTIETNTAFGDQSTGLSKTGIDRWRCQLSQAETQALQWAVGGTLETFGYPSETRRAALRLRLFVYAARPAIAFKRRLFTRTWLGRLSAAALPAPE